MKLRTLRDRRISKGNEDRQEIEEERPLSGWQN